MLYYFSSLKMEASVFSETMVNFYHTKLHQISAVTTVRIFNKFFPWTPRLMSTAQAPNSELMYQVMSYVSRYFLFFLHQRVDLRFLRRMNPHYFSSQELTSSQCPCAWTMEGKLGVHYWRQKMGLHKLSQDETIVLRDMPVSQQPPPCSIHSLTDSPRPPQLHPNIRLSRHIAR